MEPAKPVEPSVIAEQLSGPATVGTDIDNELDAVRAIEIGIRGEAADHLAARFGFGTAELCAMLRVSRATLRGRRGRGHLNAIESEPLWRAARVLACAAELLWPRRRGPGGSNETA